MIAWPAKVTKCRLCGKQLKTPAGLAKHVKSAHKMTAFAYYQFNLDQLQARIQFWVAKRRRHPSLGPCWEWTGRETGRMGYSQMRVAGAPILAAHRVSFWAHTGRLPTDGELLLHQCDNPKCVNPAHLKLGSHAENMAERQDRERQSRGARHYNGLPAPQVQSIRYHLSLGWSHSKVAEKHHVSPAAVQRIATGKTYKDVPYDPKFDANVIPF